MHSREPIADNEAAISVRNLSKRFGEITALENLDLEIAPGRILGFLGPNGAGKTTTIRILTGFLRPSTGSVHLLGHDMLSPSAALRGRRRLGFVPELGGLDTGATGVWMLDHLARLQGIEPVDRGFLMEALELSPRDLARPIGRLSKGTRQKINIIQGLQHRPDVLVLDEPSDGLDPIAKRSLFEVLETARTSGATVFFCSHVLSEVETLCDEVALIRHGRLGLVDKIDNLRCGIQRRVTLELEEGCDARSRLQALPTVSRLRQRGSRWQFHVVELGALLQLLAELPVSDVIIEPPSLEDVFLHFYEDETDDDS